LNEVEIVVTAKDQTEAVFVGIRQRAKTHGEKSSDSFKSGFSGAFARGASNFFGNIAENATGILSRSFGTAISSNPYLGGGIAAAVGAGLVAGMPAIGSLAAGGLVAAFGSGIAGIGIAVAAQSKEVQDEFDNLKSHVSGVVVEISKPFRPVLVDITRMFRGTFDQFAPYLENAFAKMAMPIRSFAGFASEGFARLRFSIGPVTEAFNALIGSVGPRLPGIFQNISNSINQVAASISSNPETFAGLVEWAGDLAAGLITLVARLSDAANWIQRNADVIIGSLGQFDELGKVWGFLGEKILGGSKSSREASDSFSSLSSTADAAGNALSRVSSIMDELNKKNMTAEQAALNLESAFDQVTESVRNNGATLNINTEKGRSNREALLNGAKAALSYRDAQVQQGASLDTANAKLNQHRERLISAAVQAGMSRKQARQYIDTILQTPSGRSTVFRTNSSSATREVITLGTQIRRLPNGKTFTFTVRTVITGPPAARIAFSNSSGSRGGRVFERASGGIVGAASGGIRSNSILVGEHGPEIVNLPTGSMVKSNPDTRRMMSESGGGSQTILVQFDFRGAANDDLVKMIRNAIRVRGGKGDGNVQAVLG
jgi:hypothetical protein